MRNSSSYSPALLEWNRVEVDKIDDVWVITYGCRDGVTLRLKVYRSSSLEPETFIAEILVKEGDAFQRIHSFESYSFALTHPEELPEDYEVVTPAWPSVWTSEFMALVQLWGRLTETAEFGSTCEADPSLDTAADGPRTNTECI